MGHLRIPAGCGLALPSSSGTDAMENCEGGQAALKAKAGPPLLLLMQPTTSVHPHLSPAAVQRTASGQQLAAICTGFRKPLFTAWHLTATKCLLQVPSRGHALQWQANTRASPGRGPGQSCSHCVRLDSCAIGQLVFPGSGASSCPPVVTDVVSMTHSPFWKMTPPSRPPVIP